MNLGYRVFVVDDDSVTPLSQKVYNDFHSRKKSIPRFANQTLNIAIAVYTLDKRKPKEIIRIDCQRVRVDANGQLDEDFQFEGLRVIANRLADAFVLGFESESESAEVAEAGSVVNATHKFDERRHAHHHPALPGPAHKRILDVLFK